MMEWTQISEDTVSDGVDRLIICTWFGDGVDTN